MKILLGIVLLASSAHAIPECPKVGISVFAFDTTVYAGYKPRTDCAYQLNAMSPLQRLPNGYLLYPYGEDGAGALYIETNAQYSQGEIISRAHAVDVKTIAYETLTGFPKKVYAFKMVPEVQISGDAPQLAEAQ